MMTFLHIVAGTIVLGVAPAAMLVRKGGRWHRRWGIAFMAAMSLVLLTAGFMWQPKGHVFLLALALVSGYFVFNGYRIVARRRRRDPDALDDKTDLVAGGVTVACGIWLLSIALTASTTLMRSLAPIMAGLGVIAIAFALNDARGILGPRSRTGSLIAHFSAMIAAYISAVTAFVVINAHGVPMELRWVVPIAVGTIVISAFALPYRLPKGGSPNFNAFFARAKR
jgi:membrane glycosyltransferase